MPEFKQRSSQAELLDAPNIPRQLLFQNLRELDLVNRTLGGHAVTLAGIKKLITDKNKIYTLADIGCGGGDVLIYIARWARKNGYRVQLIGVDINKDVIEYMKEACKEHPEITGLVSNYNEFLKMTPTLDIVHCSLFCHHLSNEELVDLFKQMKHAVEGFIVNDLHRHWFAYYSIKFLTWILNGSSLVRNDAPLSVLRGFKKKELQNLLLTSAIKDAEVKWCWAFRYLILKIKTTA